LGEEANRRGNPEPRHGNPFAAFMGVGSGLTASHAPSWWERTIDKLTSSIRLFDTGCAFEVSNGGS
jgi:hypothetical protein